MADYTVRRIDDMEGIYGGAFKRARAELGVESFGMQVIDFPPNMGDQYPEHDHGEDGQEEVYLPLSGSAENSDPQLERSLAAPRPRRWATAVPAPAIFRTPIGDTTRSCGSLNVGTITAALEIQKFA